MIQINGVEVDVKVLSFDPEDDSYTFILAYDHNSKYKIKLDLIGEGVLRSVLDRMDLHRNGVLITGRKPKYKEYLQHD